MNDERDPSSPASGDPGDPLDDWLAEARWPEPTRISTERLRARWQILATPARSHPLRRVMSIAAAIAIVAVGLWWSLRSTQTPLEQPVATAPVILPGREMTGLERTLVEALDRKLAAKKRAPNQAPLKTVATQRGAGSSPSRLNASNASIPEVVVAAPSSPPFAVRPFLERIADERTRADALAELDRGKRPPTDQLLAFLSDSRIDLRLAAALALGRIDGPVITRRLIQMVEQNQSRREAFIALASSRGREAQRYVQSAAVSEQYAGIARSAMIASQAELQ